MSSKIVLTLTAVLLVVAGAALLFEPDTFMRTDGKTGNAATAQFLAAALLGFGAANWIARSSGVGGIYGRALVVGNFVGFSIAGLVALRAFLNSRAVIFLIVAVVGITLGALFLSLMFRSSPR